MQQTSKTNLSSDWLLEQQNREQKATETGRKNKRQYSIYNRFQHCKKLEAIVKHHWPILLKDEVQAKLLPSKLRFICRRAPALRNKLVQVCVGSPRKRGFCRCGLCNAVSQKENTHQSQIAHSANTKSSRLLHMIEHLRTEMPMWAAVHREEHVS